METAASGPGTVRSAVDVLDRAHAYEAQLRRRTEGATWMVWGLASALVFLTSILADVPWQAWYVAVGLGWPLLGVVATSAVWRIAALSRPDLDPKPRPLTWGVAVASLLIVAAATLAYILSERFGTWAGLAATLVLLPWSFLAFAQWSRTTARGRRVVVATGAAMVAFAVVFFGAFMSGNETVNVLVIAATVGGVPFVVGTWHAFRGGDAAGA